MSTTKINSAKFRDLCLASKKSLPTLAAEVGVSYLTMWRLYTGTHSPKKGTRAKLAKVLGSEIEGAFERMAA